MMGLAVGAWWRLRHVIVYCLYIYKFASTTKTLKCIFYICTHKDIFFNNHTCLQLYIHYYFYTYIHRWIHFIYTCFNIYICIYFLDIHRPEKDFLWVYRKQKYDQVERFTSRRLNRQDVEGFDHYIPKNQHTVDGSEIRQTHQLTW